MTFAPGRTMRKLAITVVVSAMLLTASHRRAEASCQGGGCPAWLDVLGYTFAAGVVGGYGYGTGTFIYRDLNDPQQSLNYAVTELTVNGLLATVFTGATIDSARNHNVGATLVLGTFATLHTTLMVHGISTAYEDRGGIIIPKVPLAWVGGTLYGVNAAYWAGSMASHHQRGYGVAEIAVNAPMAAGLGYLAYDRFSSFHGGPGMVYGGMAVVSTLFVVHGIHTVIHPYEPDALDLPANLDLEPTVVDDGHERGPGLGLSRTW